MKFFISAALIRKLSIWKSVSANADTDDDNDTDNDTDNVTDNDTDNDTDNNTDTDTDKTYPLSVKPIYRPIPILKLYRSYTEQEAVTQ